MTVYRLLLAGSFIALATECAEAYIGPGAGFAVGGSFLAVFAAMLSAGAMIVSWPIRWCWRRSFANARRDLPNFDALSSLDSMDSISA